MVCETIKNEAKEQKERFLGMILRTLANNMYVIKYREIFLFVFCLIFNCFASLLGNILTSKGTIRAGEGTKRSGQNS